MYWDRFDICEAYWVFACYWHPGKRSKEYAIFGRLSRMCFKPDAALDIYTLTTNGRHILSGLIRKQIQERVGR